MTARLHNTNEPKKGAPYVSVIIPTRNRRWYLEKLVLSLFKQTYPKDCYEVIVIDNDSKDGTDRLMASYKESAPCVLKYLKKENEGPGTARNVGISMAGGSVIAFVDSDCVADLKWIENGVSKMADGVGLAQGKTLPDPDEEIGIYSHVTRIDRENSLYQTCNMFYRKDLLDELGGFSPDFCGRRFGKPCIGGEDTDLAWRIKKLGWKSVFADDAVIYHHVSTISTRELLGLIFNHRFFYNFFYVIPNILKKHPELRKGILYRRVFWSKMTAFFDLLVFSTVLGIVLPFFYLFSAVCLFLLVKPSFDGHSLKTYHKAFIRAVIGLIIQFAVFILLISGSIRYRSVVL